MKYRLNTIVLKNIVRVFNHNIYGEINIDLEFE